MNLNNLGSTELGGKRHETLGRSLVEHGWIGETELAKALGRQRDRGGRLGTCLLEIRALSEELLLVALSELLGVPKAEATNLRAIPESVHRLLPAEVAVRRRAIPFRANRQRVDIALADPDDLAVQDELSFIIGKTLTVHVATESRVYESLERYYGYECPIRYRRLLSALNQRRRGATEEAGGEKVEVRPAEGHGSGSVRSGTKPLDHLRPAGVSEESREPVPETTDEPAGPPGLDSFESPAPTIENSELEDVIHRLDHCTDVDEIGETLLEHLSGDYLRVVLLKAVKNEIRGWMGRGPGLDRERLEAFSAGLDLPSIFLNLSQGGSFFVGILPPMPPHLRLARCWADDAINPCAVLPIRIRNRPVVYVYVDRDCLGLEGIDLDALQLLTKAAANSFGNCILARKGSHD